MEKQVKECFAKNFAILRLSAGLTMTETSKKTGLSRQTLYKYEAGEMMPNVDKLELLSKAFNCEIIDFLR